MTRPQEAQAPCSHGGSLKAGPWRVESGGHSGGQGARGPDSGAQGAEQEVCQAEGSAGRTEPPGKEEGASAPRRVRSWVLVESGPCEGVCGRTDLQTVSGSV